ncbi:MAG: hypothetical protein QOE11_3558 [Solirubrobacteraceae bacterium]|jgi:hypothetical protein|nr:hypothetical protein [Solirubrobacteraceae bacterium]
MRRTMPFISVLLASLALAAPASADLATDVLKDYIPDQRLNVCAYTQDQLKKIKNAVPLDQNAYTPDFIAAIDDAIARRAEGACNKKKAVVPVVPAPATSGTAAPPPPPSAKQAAPAPVATPGQAPVAQPPPTPAADPAPAPGVVTDAIPQAAHITAAGGSAPFPILALAILAGLLALGGLLATLVHWFAWEPAWAHRARHATGEAGWRASSTWAEFTDFVRFGR